MDVATARCMGRCSGSTRAIAKHTGVLTRASVLRAPLRTRFRRRMTCPAAGTKIPDIEEGQAVQHNKKKRPGKRLQPLKEGLVGGEARRDCVADWHANLSGIRRSSTGTNHLRSSLNSSSSSRYDWPSGGNPTGHTEAAAMPLSVLPLGGLGEIGMNCMLIGHHDRYIMVDAGINFPKSSTLKIDKELPDPTFAHRYRDKIEAVVITHGHEDHIGALPWILGALNPEVPLFANKFTMQLIRRKLKEYRMWEDSTRPFVTFDGNSGERFDAGPFEVQPIRVTHSIPDCSALVLRCEDGTILHTGDWRFEDEPVDSYHFNHAAFEELGREGVTLMLSDSTNVHQPGRSISESRVADQIMQRVEAHRGKGRVLATMFGSNISRIQSFKRAADATGRRLALLGPSYYGYLSAARYNDCAPFDIGDTLYPPELEYVDPNEQLLIVSGSQGEQYGQVSLAAMGTSRLVDIRSSDLFLYSAKVIPGNEVYVTHMMNKLAMEGCRIEMGQPGAELHTTGHAHRDELKQLISMVMPEHFVPVHGTHSGMQLHRELAREAGVVHTSSIANGTHLGVAQRRSRREVASSSLCVLGEAKLSKFFFDVKMKEARAMFPAEEQMMLHEQTEMRRRIQEVSVSLSSGPGSNFSFQRPVIQEQCHDSGPNNAKNPKPKARRKSRVRVVGTRGNSAISDAMRAEHAEYKATASDVDL